MSRIGRKPVAIPKGVVVTLKDGSITVKGPKGELNRELPSGITVAVDGGAVQVTRPSDEPPVRSRHGLVRALIQNMVTGVVAGYERKLEINGVGYKAELAGDTLTLALGLSHPVVYKLPKGVGAKIEKNIVTISGVDKESVGRAAAQIRSYRPPEPYQGKGVKYLEETIRRKVGKAGAA